MKKIMIIFLTVCGIVLSNNIQAKNIDNINGVWLNNNRNGLVVTKDILLPDKSNTELPFPSADLMLLAIIGVFLARKHQSLAKKHCDLAKKHKDNFNPDSVFHH